MKTKLKTFGVFCNCITGYKVKAKNFEDLVKNRMTKRQKEFWSEIKYKDENENTIVIHREYLEEQGMTFDEIVQDYLEYASDEDLNEVINVL